MSNAQAWAQPYDGAFYEAADLLFDDEKVSYIPGKYAPDTLVRKSEVEWAWMSSAACSETDPDSFFPDRGEQAKVARKVCDQCPVRQACLDYALANGDTIGIWGGTTGSERARMLKATA